MQSFKLMIRNLLCFCWFVYISATLSSCEKQQKPSLPTLQEALTLFKTNPQDCFAAEQLAGIYQAENNITSALQYYNIAVENCSDNVLNYFQLGVCHLLAGERGIAEEYMTKAISLADRAQDMKTKEMLEKEKTSWLEHKQLEFREHDN